ncbi:MAG: 3-oxoacyl-ACP reductase [Actinobacteria bacterium]|nr:3-oxoacyl-ACP reductase [Actinomycetota bacterium]
MSDRYQQLVNSPLGKQLAESLGLPRPVALRRYEPGDPVLHGPAVVAGAGDAPLLDPTLKVLQSVDASVVTEVPEDPRSKYAALIFDASAIGRTEDLREAWAFFNRLVRHMDRSARLVVLGRPPSDGDDPHAAAAQRALEGFVRSAGKEMRKGSTANLLQVAEGAEGGIESTLRFLLSGRSAYVSGQVLRVDATEEDPLTPADWDQPLDERVAVVTGAARGIGEHIAEVLARDGAHVVCLDVPAQGDQLKTVANRIGGSTLQLDITADDAPERLATHLRERHGGVDILVHNAGITRDKTLVGMDDSQWDAVLAVNLTSQLRINDRLLDEGLLNDHGRIVSISSISGIAGNRGQTNYAASKAGIIGMVAAYAPQLEERRGTINAVAPGFIETDMTDEMPFATREVGRRINSLNQGGQPVDVAETVAWLANPSTAGVNGRVVRVCGQQWFGA